MQLVIAATTSFRRLLDAALIALILVVLAALAVARLVPAVTHAPAFVVGGGSMEPTIPLGAVVITEPVAVSDLHVGDVVSVQVGPQRSVFTHRITRIAVDVGATWIQTKGDANPSQDPSMVPASDVLGRVSTTIPWLGYAVQLLSIPQGVALLVSAGLAVLLGAYFLEGLEDDQRAWAYRRRLERADLTPVDAVGEVVAG